MHSRHRARRTGMIARIPFLGLLVSALSAQVGESQGRGFGFPGDWTLEGGGTSGIIIDNNSRSGQASSIYFSTETAPLNAVKLTQQNLN